MRALKRFPIETLGCIQVLFSIVLKIPNLAPVFGTKHFHVTFFSVAESPSGVELNTSSIQEVNGWRVKYMSNKAK